MGDSLRVSYFFQACDSRPISFIVSLWIERAAERARSETFLRLTEQLLEIAQAGEGACDLTILVDAGGGLFLSSLCDWPLDRLAAERGAQAGWRIRRRREGVRIEACADARRCRFYPKPALIPDRLPAGSAQLLPAALG